MDATVFRTSELAVIDFIERYGMATNKTICSSILIGRSLNAVSKVTARMRREQLISRYSLFHPEFYFRFGPNTARQRGYSPRHTQPLGPQSLPVAYAVLIYATQGDVRRRRLKETELADYLPWLPDDLIRSPYCLDEAGRLEMLRVDLGGSPRHVARKVSAATHKRLAIPEFSDLVAQRLFQVTVLTTSTLKASLIAAALGEADFGRDINVHLAIVPQLSRLLLCSRS